MLNLILDYPFKYHDEKYFYLYRHMSFQDYYLKSIEEFTLYFSSPANFNDPFDSYFCLAEQPSKNFHNKILKNLGYTGSPAKKILYRKKSQKLLDQSFVEGSFFEERFKRIGVICLNHNPLNILMWSHYANYHKGFLIELRFPKSKEILNLIDFLPFPIVCSNEFPKGNIENFDDKQLYKMLYTKSMDWSYESEFRILGNGLDSINDINRKFNYPNEWLTSVILGCNTSKEDVDKIHTIIKNIENNRGHKIGVFEAKKSSSNYKLIVPKHPRLANI